MKTFQRIVALLIAASALEHIAMAQQPAERNDRTPHRAFLVMQSSTGANLHWTGQAPGRDGVQLCIGSTSGRYALMVASTSGEGLVGAQPLGYSVRFESGGVVRTAQISHDTPLVRFDGDVAPDRGCDRGPNARIVISLDNAQALSASAGDYGDRVRLVVEPR